MLTMHNFTWKSNCSDQVKYLNLWRQALSTLLLMGKVRN